MRDAMLTALGWVEIAFEGETLTACHLTDAPAPPERTAFSARALREIGEYLAGERRTFDLPTAAAGTAFQQRVWAELRRIPYGGTATYGEIARRIGSPGAARAVGQACGRNPIWLVVPCHRVIGADGSLTGYEGGVDVKRRLLALERERVRRL